jgi:tetratricopeptide (TPR) repeat protein
MGLTQQLTLCSVLLLSTIATGQDRGSGLRSYLLVDRTAVRGEVLRVDGESVLLRIPIAEGNMEWEYRLDRFTPASIYHIRAAVAPDDDAAVHLELAEFALGVDQVSLARASLANARQIAGDPGLGTALERRFAATEASKLEARFFRQLGDGDIDTAGRTLITLSRRFPEEITAERVATLQQELDRERDRRRGATAAAAAKRVEGEQQDEQRRWLAALASELDGAHSAWEQALRSTGSFVQATELFDRAVTRGELVLRSAKGLEGAWADRPEAIRELDRLREDAERLVLDARLGSASQYLTRGSFSQAMESVNRILLDDPRNPQALAMRGRIETAANEAWGWYWTWRLLGTDRIRR